MRGQKPGRRSMPYRLRACRGFALARPSPDSVTTHQDAVRTADCSQNPLRMVPQGSGQRSPPFPCDSNGS